MHHYLRTALVLALALGTAACDEKTYLFVQSNTEFSGALHGSRAYEYSDDENIYIELRSGTFCWKFSKLTEEGYLRTFVREGTAVGPDELRREETSEPYGSVDGCYTVD
jgi:hypothetical protein